MQLLCVLCLHVMLPLKLSPPQSIDDETMEWMKDETFVGSCHMFSHSTSCHCHLIQMNVPCVFSLNWQAFLMNENQHVFVSYLLFVLRSVLVVSVLCVCVCARNSSPAYGKTYARVKKEKTFLLGNSQGHSAKHWYSKDNPIHSLQLSFVCVCLVCVRHTYVLRVCHFLRLPEIWMRLVSFPSTMVLRWCSAV